MDMKELEAQAKEIRERLQVREISTMKLINELIRRGVEGTLGQYSEINVVGEDDELIASITADDVITKDGYEVVFIRSET